MGRIIYGQVLAGSGPDIQGEGIDRETIKHLFGQIQRHAVGGVCHDLSQRPSVRAFNFRLEESPDKELLIKADLEVLDEAIFGKMGGFSIAYTRNTCRIGSLDVPLAKILINPDHFDFDGICESVFRLVPSKFTVDVTERIEKAAIFETALIVIVATILTELGRGFMSAAGADLYHYLKSLRRKDDPSGPIKIQLHTQESPTTAPYILDIDPDVTPEEFSKIRLPSLDEILPPGFEPRQIVRVVGRVEPGPYVILRFAVLQEGSSISLTAE